MNQLIYMKSLVGSHRSFQHPYPQHWRKKPLTKTILSPLGYFYFYFILFLFLNSPKKKRKKKERKKKKNLYFLNDVSDLTKLKLLLSRFPLFGSPLLPPAPKPHSISILWMIFHRLLHSSKLNPLIPGLAIIIHILGSASNCIGSLVFYERDTVNRRFSSLIFVGILVFGFCSSYAIVFLSLVLFLHFNGYR